MNYTNLHYQTSLGLLSGVGPKTGKALLEKLHSLEELFTTTAKKLSKKTGYKISFFNQLNTEEILELSDKVIEFNKKHNIRSIFYTDAAFPYRLNECADGPLMLYQKGELPLNDQRYVAIVGTRDCTDYGIELCRQLIESFQGKSITVVSGLAHGIDYWVHKFCVKYNVPTIGVLGHGLDRIYPAVHRDLAKKMLQNGSLLTEFIPWTNPDRENFPKRNRIVAGLCDATIVIESKIKGGSLITARLANDYNRDVFACPGNILKSTSIGCNSLIANDEAHLLQSPEQFLEVMNWNDNPTHVIQQRKIFPNLNDEQKSILSIIEASTKIQIDQLAISSSMPISKLNTILFYLELEGVITRLPGNMYAAA